MRAGGMAGDIDALGIGAEAGGVFVDPGDGAADLLRHRQQIAAGLLNLHEVEDDEVGAGVDEHLGRTGEIFGLAVAPCAAVDVDIHRRIGPVSFVDVELFMLTGAVGDALRRTESFQGRRTGGGAAFGEQLLIGA